MQKNLVENILDINTQLANFQKKGNAYKKTHGFNSAPCKEESFNNSYIMTDYICGYTKVLNKKTNRYNKKPIYKKLYDSLDSAFKANASQRQVFTGLNHYRRDLIVCDIDSSENYFPCFDTSSQLERITYIHSLCKEYSLPKPSYIEFHKDSGNCQLGWYLDEYFINYNREGNDIKSNLYKDLIQGLAFLFKSDTGFKGGNIKNPYHKNNTAYFHSVSPINTEGFIEGVQQALSNLGRTLTKPRGISKVKKRRTLDKSFQRDIKVSNETSRNCYAVSHTRSWVFIYMREHGGKLPSFEETYKVFEGFEIKSLPLVGKYEIENSAQISASCRSLLNFCKKNYDEKKAKEIISNSVSREIQDKRRHSSIITKKAQSAIRYFRAINLKRQGYTQKEIARELCCTQASVSILFKKYTEDICLDNLVNYVRYHINSSQQKHIALIEEIKSILPFLQLTLDELIAFSKSSNLIEPTERVSFYALDLLLLEELFLNGKQDFLSETLHPEDSCGDPFIRAG